MAEDNPSPEAHPTSGFPAYRRLKGTAQRYRIDGPDSFTELQPIGSRIVVHTVRASTYPERLRIADMLQGDGGRYEAITEEEWRTAFPRN